jgi:UDP-N-acetylglucosamine 3-dehydrogenase
MAVGSGRGAANGSRTLRAGLIGLGMMGRHHARVLRAIEGVELVAVADPVGDPHDVAGGLALHRSVEDLMKAGLDYCVVAVPTAYHERIGLALAEAGVHALVEKPLAPDGDGARRLAQTFGARGLVGAVGHIERYNPALQHLRARLEHGELGSVYQIVTRRQGPFPARIADVGVVKDLATHDIDLTAWVSRSRFRSVAARTAFKSGREFEDLVAVVGSLEDGTVTNHLVNWLSPMKERVTIVTGEKGTFVADTLTADLTFFANGTVPTQWGALAEFRGVSEGDVVRYAIAKPEPLRTEHEAFRDAVLGKEADIVTMEQGLATVAVAEAVIESAGTGRTVDVRLPEISLDPASSVSA